MTETVAPPHPFDAAVGLTPLTAGLSTGETNPAYNNMVGPFGGVTAATLLESVLKHPERLGDPLSLTVNFAGPITEGAFEISARPVRTNRSTQHWSIELSQDGTVATTATAVFGTRRETWSSTEITMPEVPSAEDVALLPFPRVHRLGTELRDALCRRCNPRPGVGRASRLDHDALGARSAGSRSRLHVADCTVRCLLPTSFLAPRQDGTGWDGLDDHLLPRRRSDADRTGRQFRAGNRADPTVRQRVLRSVGRNLGQ